MPCCVDTVEWRGKKWGWEGDREREKVERELEVGQGQGGEKGLPGPNH